MKFSCIHSMEFHAKLNFPNNFLLCFTWAPFKLTHVVCTNLSRKADKYLASAIENGHMQGCFFCKALSTKAKVYSKIVSPARSGACRRRKRRCARCAREAIFIVACLEAGQLTSFAIRQVPCSRRCCRVDRLLTNLRILLCKVR